MFCPADGVNVTNIAHSRTTLANCTTDNLNTWRNIRVLVTSYCDHKIDINSKEAAEHREDVLGGMEGQGGSQLDKANLQSQPNIASASLTMYPERWLPGRCEHSSCRQTSGHR